MRASTILLVTFLIWLTAKGRLQSYWQLATTNSSALSGDAGPDDNASHAVGSSGFSLDNFLNNLSNDYGIDIKVE